MTVFLIFHLAFLFPLFLSLSLSPSLSLSLSLSLSRFLSSDIDYSKEALGFASAVINRLQAFFSDTGAYIGGQSKGAPVDESLLLEKYV